MSHFILVGYNGLFASQGELSLKTLLEKTMCFIHKSVSAFFIEHCGLLRLNLILDLEIKYIEHSETKKSQ